MFSSECYTQAWPQIPRWSFKQQLHEKTRDWQMKEVKVKHGVLTNVPRGRYAFTPRSFLSAHLHLLWPDGAQCAPLIFVQYHKSADAWRSLHPGSSQQQAICWTVSFYFLWNRKQFSAGLQPQDQQTRSRFNTTPTLPPPPHRLPPAAAGPGPAAASNGSSCAGRCRSRWWQTPSPTRWSWPEGAEPTVSPRPHKSHGRAGYCFTGGINIDPRQSE